MCRNNFVSVFPPVLGGNSAKALLGKWHIGASCLFDCLCLVYRVSTRRQTKHHIGRVSAALPGCGL